jgi:uncharacterized protein YndB with AHSA1/START domain
MTKINPGGSSAVSGTTDGDYRATINVTAAPDTVFDALTSPAAISNWWVTASGGGTTGDALFIHFGDTRAIFHVAEVERASRVRWTVLDCEIEHDWVGTEIIFDLCPAPDGGTRVDFRHHGLTPQLECFEDCRSGWTQALGGLMNYVEAGKGQAMNDSNLKTEPSTSFVNSTKEGGDFQAVLTIKATPDAVFNAFTNPADLTNWWTPASGVGTTGGELVFRFGDQRLFCRVDDAERPSRVRWSVLRCEPVPDWLGTEIAVDLSPTGDGGTCIDFRHHGLTPQLECFEMCQNGWTHHLGDLINAFEAGNGIPSVPEAN